MGNSAETESLSERFRASEIRMVQWNGIWDRSRRITQVRKARWEMGTASVKSDDEKNYPEAKIKTSLMFEPENLKRTLEGITGYVQYNRIPHYCGSAL